MRAYPLARRSVLSLWEQIKGIIIRNVSEHVSVREHVAKTLAFYLSLQKKMYAGLRRRRWLFFVLAEKCMLACCELRGARQNTATKQAFAIMCP